MKRIFILLFVCIQSIGFGQFGLNFNSTSDVSFCSAFVIEGTIERSISSSSETGPSLRIQFTQAMALEDFTGNLILINATETVFEFDLTESECDFTSAEFTFIPACNQQASQFTADIQLTNSNNQLLSNQELFFFLNTPAVEVTFGDYRYRPETNVLSKTVTITNLQDESINEIAILPKPSRNFADLVNEPFMFTKKGDTLFADVPLNPLESFDVFMQFELNECDLQTIEYDILFGCSANECRSTQSFIDENELVSTNVTVDAPLFNIGLCGELFSQIMISNFDNGISSAVGDIYNLSIALDDLNPNFSNTFVECFELQARSDNGSPITTTIINDITHVIDFSSITSDPDGPGGLSDLDNDGQYDDIALNNNAVIEVGTVVKRDCYDQYSTQAIDLDIITEYATFCQRTTTERTIADDFAFLSTAAYYSTSTRDPLGLNISPSNDFSASEGDTIGFIFEISPSRNINNNCGSDTYIWTLDIPPNIEPDPTTPFMTNLRDNTQRVIEPVDIIGDTLFIFELEIDPTNLRNGINSITKDFIAKCINQNIAGVNTCQECLSIQNFRFRSTVQKECSLNCQIPLPIRTSISPEFNIICDTQPEEITLISIEPCQVFNLSPGIIDTVTLETRNIFNQPSSLNNRVFFEGDSILFRFPIDINCTEELEQFEVILEKRGRFNTLTDYTFHSATVHTLEDDIVINSCDFTDRITSTSRSFLNILFEQSDLMGACFDLDKTHYVDVIATPAINCTANQCPQTSEQIVNAFIAEQSTNGCERNYLINNLNIFIHQTFVPTTFEINNIQFTETRFSLFQTNKNQFPIYEPADAVGEFSSEYKFVPILRELSLTVPEGYELVDSFRLITTETFERPFGNGFNLSNTLLSLAPNTTVNSDGTTTYQFNNNNRVFYHDQIYEGVFGEYIIKANCTPEVNPSEIIFSGSIEYVDFAKGTLDTLSHDFTEIIPIEFLPDTYELVDNFIESTNQSTTSFLINVANNTPAESLDSLRDDLESKYRFTYQSNGTIIDSIIISENNFNTGPGILSPVETQNFKINDSTIDVRSIGMPVEDFLAQQIDTLFVFPDAFTIFTSAHPCGFDTIFYQIGIAAEFENSDCSSSTINDDFFVVFTSEGFPKISLDSIPEFITINEENSIFFTLENIGSAPIVDNTIFINNLADKDFELWSLNAIGNRDQQLNNLISFEDDIALVELAGSNLDTLDDAASNKISAWSFELVLLDPCPNEQFFSINIFAESSNICVGQNISQIIQSPPAIYVDRSEEILYEVINNSVSNINSCGDTLTFSVQINQTNNSSELLSNSIIDIELANDLTVFQNGITINNQQINNAQTIPSENTSRTIIRIEYAEELQDNSILTMSIDGTCIDQCRQEDILISIFSPELALCQSQQSPINKVKGIGSLNSYNWKPSINIEDIAFTLGNIGNDSVEIILQTTFTNNASTPFNGSVFIDLFNDINDNDEVDPGEQVDRFPIENDFIDQTLVMDYVSTLPFSSFCSLEMSIANESGCDCSKSHSAIAEDNTFISDTEVNYCGQDPIEIPLASFSNSCVSTISLPRGVDFLNDSTLVLDPSTFSENSFRINRSCGGCSFIDNFDVSEFIYPFNLSIQNTNCTNPEGSLSVVEFGDEFLFGLDEQSLSRETAFESLPNGNYTIFVQNNSGCIDSMSFEIMPEDTIPISIPTELNIPSPSTIEFNSNQQIIQDAVWLWSSSEFELSCTDCPFPTALAETSGVVNLTITLGECTFNRVISVIIPDNAVYIPNAFRPSSIQNNERFRISPNSSFDRLTLKIFDRWGSLVFQEDTQEFSSDQSGWDGLVNGDLASSGVYVYIATIERFSDNEVLELVGDFILFH